MSDNKERYSIEAHNYIEQTVSASSIDQERYNRSKLREEKFNDSWCEQKVNLNEIIAKFIDLDSENVRVQSSGGIKFIFEDEKYIIKCDKVAGYLRIYDKEAKAYCTIDGIPSEDESKTHFKILRREEMDNEN